MRQKKTRNKLEYYNKLYLLYICMYSFDIELHIYALKLILYSFTSNEINRE